MKNKTLNGILAVFFLLQFVRYFWRMQTQQTSTLLLIATICTGLAFSVCLAGFLTEGKE